MSYINEALNAVNDAATLVKAGVIELQPVVEDVVAKTEEVVAEHVPASVDVDMLGEVVTSVYSDLYFYAVSFGIWNSLLTVVCCAVSLYLWRLFGKVAILFYHCALLQHDLGVAFEAMEQGGLVKYGDDGCYRIASKKRSKKAA